MFCIKLSQSQEVESQGRNPGLASIPWTPSFMPRLPQLLCQGSGAGLDHSKAGHITCEGMMGGEHLNSTLSQPSFEDSSWGTEAEPFPQSLQACPLNMELPLVWTSREGLRGGDQGRGIPRAVAGDPGLH